MIKKIAIALSMLILLSNSVNAQWKKIADFKGLDVFGGTASEPVSCVYFLDLPGPPRIGFVGTGSELYKTIDGGKNWHSVWDSGRASDEYFPDDICFKDSLTGWFTVFDEGAITGDECYRTTDGGETWTKLNVPGVYYSYGFGIYYSFTSGRLFLFSDTLMRISMDLGTTWPDSLPYYGGLFSFSSPSLGIAGVDFYPDTTSGFITTSNGGVTWDTMHSTYAGMVYCVPGTSICFMVKGADSITIYRSDDLGRTWRIISTPVFYHQYCTEIIRGVLSRLYLQTDSGMYVSIDEGVTWNFDGGPPYSPGGINDLFYSANGITVAGMTYSDGWLESGGLWEETWPQSGVPEQEPISNSLRVFPNPAADKLEITGGPAGTARLFDLLGREVLEANMGGASTPCELDISKLLPGTYFLRVGTQSAKVVIAR